MKIPLTFYLSEKFIRKDGTCPIYIQYNYNQKSRPLLNTKIHIPPAFWDKKLSRIRQTIPPEFGFADGLNYQLKEIFRIAEDIVVFSQNNQVLNPDIFVKNTFQPEFDVLSLQNIERKIEKKDAFPDTDLYFQIDDYIQSKTKKVCKDMPRIYRNMKEYLLEFEVYRGEPITFDCLNLTFYEEFVDFLMYEYVQRRRKIKIVGLKVNTVGNTIKQFRTFLRNRNRKGIIPPLDMDGWKILEEEVDAVYLNWNEIKKIFQIDLSGYPHLVGEIIKPLW